MFAPMSWGYFADLQLTVPTKAWAELRARTPGAVTLERGWSGLEDQELESAFSQPFAVGDTFARILAGPAFNTAEALNRAAADGAGTSARVCLMLDKSSLELAYAMAALFHAARSVDGTKGTFRLVNDGTYSGESGVVLTLSDGKIAKERIKDLFALVDELAAEIFAAAQEAASKSSKPRVLINPFTKEPIVPSSRLGSSKVASSKAVQKSRTKAPATKRSATRPVPKKPAARKPAKAKPAKKPSKAKKR